jgi:hypothetical protein
MHQLTETCLIVTLDKVGQVTPIMHLQSERDFWMAAQLNEAVLDGQIKVTEYCVMRSEARCTSVTSSHEMICKGTPFLCATSHSADAAQQHQAFGCGSLPVLCNLALHGQQFCG